ncbi:hypothetical protein AB205_0180030 [Aquarana catesbeiana]|uniref:Uncharacterized protein n=1 Tax=Aquarana catesbeiana TaxID=8400 RepID=A0A2G9RM08_AQUCT|nr:hypothetical protein AB205_0180030 [Aquarana catesbeiana]
MYQTLLKIMNRKTETFLHWTSMQTLGKGCFFRGIVIFFLERMHCKEFIENHCKEFVTETAKYHCLHRIPGRKVLIQVFFCTAI